MNKRSFGSSLHLIGYAFAVASLFLLVRGYQFNTDDQAEHLPQIYQMMDTQLYPSDYFVNASNSIFTVRFYYEKLVLAVAETIGLEWGLFILTFICIALMAYSFSRLTEVFFRDGWAILLAPIFTLFVFYNFTVGGNHVMYASFISSTIGKALGAFGLLQYFNNSPKSAGIWFGMATLFQPLVGLQLFMVCLAVEFFVVRNWKRSVQTTLTYLPVSAFILIPVFARQFGTEASYDKGLYYHILYEFRNYHHYLPHLFPTSHYMKFFALTVIGMLAYAIVRPNDQFRVRGVVAWGIFGMLIYVLALELLGIQGIGKLQWFKVTVWISAFNSIVLAGLVGQFLSGFMSASKLRKHLFPLSIFATVIVLVVITNSKFLPESLQNNYMVGNRNYSELEKMHFWIESNTGKDVSVLVSPDDNAFACQAKRSMPIHFQAIIHEPFFMLPWYEDYKEIYGVSIENLEGIDSRKAAVDLYQTRHYRGDRKQIDLRLDNLETCEFTNELGRILHQEGPWVLSEFKAEHSL